MLDTTKEPAPDAHDFFHKNRRMVFFIAKSFRGKQWYDDVVSACDLMLWKFAAFSDKRDAPYIFAALRNTAIEAYREATGMKASEARWKAIAKKITDDYEKEFGFKPSTEYVMAQLPQDDAYRKHIMLCGMRARRSLNEPLPGEETLTLEDTLVDDRPLQYDTVDAVLLKDDMQKALNCLPADYRDVIQRYYLEGVQVRQLAREYGCTHQNISIKVASALRMLKKHFKLKKFKKQYEF